MPITEKQQKKIQKTIREYPYSDYDPMKMPFEKYLGRIIYTKVQDRLGLGPRAFTAEFKQYTRTQAQKLNGYEDEYTTLTKSEGRKPREGSHASMRKKRARPEDTTVKVIFDQHGFRPPDPDDSDDDGPKKKKQKFSLVDNTGYDSQDDDLPAGKWYRADYGDISFISPGTPPHSPVHEMLDEHDLPLTTAPTNPSTVPFPVSGTKSTGDQQITPDQVRTWKAVDRKTFRPDQGTVMGCSAKAAAAAANLNTDESVNGWEWLHLISFQMGGIGGYPQLSSNFVAGTYDANSEMIGLEEAVKQVVLENDITVTVNVSCNVIPGTHVGVGTMDYVVTYNGRTANYEFDVRSLNRPFSGVNPLWLEHLRRTFGFV